MTTWADFCAGSKKDSQAVFSLRLGVPVGPQLVREGGCALQSAIFMVSVGVPSCFLVTSQVVPRKVWNGSLTHTFLFWSSQGLRLGMRRKDWLIRELWKAVISVPWDLRLDASRGADNARGSRAAVFFYVSCLFPGERSVNVSECEY